jgi:hypothetical protein
VHSCIRRPRPIVVAVAVVAVAAAAAGEVEVAVEGIADIAENPGEVAGTWFLSKGWQAPRPRHWPSGHCILDSLDTAFSTTFIIPIIPLFHIAITGIFASNKNKPLRPGNKRYRLYVYEPRCLKGMIKHGSGLV